MLGQIAADVRSPRPALLGVDLVNAYPPDVLMPDAPPRRQAWVDILATGRDVAVFVPITITWLSLWLAFRKFRNAAPNTNFLQLWADGFGGVAVIVVALLVALVVVITIVLHVLTDRIEQAASRERQRQEVGGHLALLSVELTRAAADQAAVLPSRTLLQASENIAGGAVRFSETMTAATRRMDKLFGTGPEAAYTAAMNRWSASADKLEAMGKSLTVPDKLITDFLAMRAGLVADEKATREALRNLLGAMNESARAAQEQAGRSISVADSVLEQTREVGIAMDTFVTHSEGLYSYLDALRRVLAFLDDEHAAGTPAGPGMSNADGRGLDGTDDPRGTGGEPAPHPDLYGTDGPPPRDPYEPRPPARPGPPADPRPVSREESPPARFETQEEDGWGRWDDDPPEPGGGGLPPADATERADSGRPEDTEDWYRGEPG